MSILSVVEIEAREGRISNESRDYLRRYHVSTSKGSTAAEVLAASALPKLNDAYPGLPTVYVKELSAKQQGRYKDKTSDAELWEVAVAYNSTSTVNTPSVKDTNKTDDPVFGRPDVSFSFVRYQEVATKTMTGSPIQNSAGDPFDPPVMRDKVNALIQATVNVRTVNVGAALAYVGTINTSDTRVAGCYITARKGRMNSVTVKPQYDSAGRLYYQVTYEIEVTRDDQGFDLEVLDQGFYYLDAGVKKRIVGADNKAVEVAQKLNGSGGKLADGATPVYKKFQVCEARNWRAGLNLP